MLLCLLLLQENKLYNNEFSWHKQLWRDISGHLIIFFKCVLSALVKCYDSWRVSATMFRPSHLSSSDAMSFFRQAILSYDFGVLYLEPKVLFFLFDRNWIASTYIRKSDEDRTAEKRMQDRLTHHFYHVFAVSRLNFLSQRFQYTLQFISGYVSVSIFVKTLKQLPKLRELFVGEVFCHLWIGPPG